MNALLPLDFIQSTRVFERPLIVDSFAGGGGASTMQRDLNALRQALAGCNESETYVAHARAKRWWACKCPALCCRAHLFGNANPATVYRDFAALDSAAVNRNFEGMIEAWALCERWVSCLESEAPACHGKKKEAA